MRHDRTPAEFSEREIANFVRVLRLLAAGATATPLRPDLALAQVELERLVASEREGLARRREEVA